MFEFDSVGVSRIAAAAGAEFVIFDMEHTGWSIETIRMLIATTRSSETIPMARVPATEYHFIARMLDMGALGIMVPMVEDAEQAKRIVQSAKYPPLGRRGTAFTVAHDNYQGGDISEKIEWANRETMIIAQIETVGGLENAEEIAAVEGVDILWIGGFDLTSSMGIPAQFDHPDFQAAVDRVANVCNRHDKVAGMMVGTADEATDLINRGFRCIAYGGDLWIYQQALREALDTIRSGVSPKK